uniref:Vacuolar protein sorting-associated protein 18 homolog n=1 Tax=Ditylenchus dipsaci TaxID=166011 RepID=A0A915DBF1_9BILA
MKTLVVKPLRKLKGMTISALGWNLDYAKDSETAFIVLGTTKGAILETNITSSGSMSYLKSLCTNLNQDGKELPVTDLHLHQCSENDDDRFVLLICMPGRLYCLCGTANLNAAPQQQAQPVVGTVWSITFNFGEGRPRCHSQSDETSMLSALAVYPIALNESPTKYCWMSAEGLSIGTLDTTQDIGIPTGSVGRRVSSDAFDMLVEQAHVKHKRGASKVVGMTRDVASQFIWVFAESALFKYRPFEETRHIWRIYLERKEFGKARKITSQMVHEDPAPYQIVIKKEAEKFIADKNYEAAAELLALSLEPFEAIVLKFLKDGSASRNGLKRYLELKLNKMDRSEDKVRRDILVIWLLEIQLGELAELRRNHSQEEDVLDGVGSGASNPSSKDTITARASEVKKLREELYCFLNRSIVNESINNNRPVVYRMISSHVDFETQLHLANKLKVESCHNVTLGTTLGCRYSGSRVILRDYDVVLKILLLQRNYKQVLEVLVQQTNAQFFYKYAPELITQMPMELVKALIENKRILQPTHLLPVFYKCFDTNMADFTKKLDPKVLAATFYYLDHVVGVPGSAKVDLTVHNFYIQLHATFKPTTLLDHLKKFGKKRSKLTYDVEMALRICVEKKLTECCVFLHCILGQYHSAVKLALTVSVELGIECAKELNHLLNRQSDDFLMQMTTDSDGSSFLEDDLDYTESDGHRDMEELRKLVWLEIAKKMIETNQENVESCLALLKESNEAIRIQDILPYFPEFTKIQHFKDPLCACLKEHSLKIQQLQKEMKEASEMAEEISADVDKNKSKFMVVKSSDKCFKCKDILMSQPFFAFTCRHFFHKQCLERHMIKEEFSKDECQLYAKLAKEEKVLKKRVEMMKLDGRQREQAILDCKATQDLLRELLAEDCPMCGDRIVNSIDKPLFNPTEYQEELKLWSFT